MSCLVFFLSSVAQSTPLSLCSCFCVLFLSNRACALSVVHPLGVLFSYFCVQCCPVNSSSLVSLFLCPVLPDKQVTYRNTISTSLNEETDLVNKSHLMRRQIQLIRVLRLGCVALVITTIFSFFLLLRLQAISIFLLFLNTFLYSSL